MDTNEVDLNNLLLEFQLLQGKVQELVSTQEQNVNVTSYTGYEYNYILLLVMGLFAFFMQFGFAILEAGSLRSKSGTNIMMITTLDAIVGSILYWAIGWAFAFGESSNAFIGHSGFFLSGVDTIDYANWFFQSVFAVKAATIVSGAIAERCNIIGYLLCSALIIGFIYPIGSHWAWSSTGFLAINGPGFKDFAGSCVVHVVGGTSALIGALMLGPRIGRFTDGRNTPIAGHSTIFAALGGLVLWMGFYAFNAGAQLMARTDQDAEIMALIFVNTSLSGAAGAFFAMIIKYFSTKGENYFSLLTLINGLLGGMVSICGSCDAVEPWAAFCIGAVSAFVYTSWGNIMIKLRIDDPLEATPVHLGCGIWGTLAGPMFANPKRQYAGIFYTGSKDAFKQFGWNLMGLCIYIAWTSFFVGALFTLLKYTGRLRIKEVDETVGLDERKHNEPAYPEYSEMSKLTTEFSVMNQATINNYNKGSKPCPDNLKSKSPPPVAVVEKSENASTVVVVEMPQRAVSVVQYDELVDSEVQSTKSNKSEAFRKV